MLALVRVVVPAAVAVVVNPSKLAWAAPLVVAPVPPLATGKAVPERPIAIVPELVMGDPLTDRKVGTLTATLVTDPEAPAFDASSLTTPEAFLKYSFSSVVLMASSPAARFA